MRPDHFPSDLSEARIRARRLLKSLIGDDSSAARRAAERLCRLETLPDAPEELLASRRRVRLKHALTTLALEHGHPSWTAMKEALENPRLAEEPSGREMYEKGLDVLFNRWFARYDDARRSLDEMGGFLFPFDHQFFITEEEGVRVLGLDPADPDWQKIGHDWVEPRDDDAWQRLRAQRRRAMRSAG